MLVAILKLVQYLSDFPPGRIWYKGHSIGAQFYAQIKTHMYLSQKMLDPRGIPHFGGTSGTKQWTQQGDGLWGPDNQFFTHLARFVFNTGKYY